MPSVQTRWHVYSLDGSLAECGDHADAAGSRQLHEGLEAP